MESFNSRFRDELLNIELFTSVQEAKLLDEQHRIESYTYRPQSAFQGLTRLEVLQQLKAAWPPTSSQKNWTSKGSHVSFAWITSVPSPPTGQYLDRTRQ